MSKEKNLKPFEKGVSGNPGGRPKWKQVTEIMKSETNTAKLETMIDKVFDLALEGNMRAVEFIADRLEGKVAQRVELSTKSDQPIKVFDIEGIDDDEKPHTELLEHVTTDSNH
ncbi:MAG: DUF5681 domain-containing protein [Candidatus Marinimicrobia bacterium]|nr:DUF5681 domain-containing protein [Candidatus Neomarinimicrobiota bacterium]